MLVPTCVAPVSHISVTISSPWSSPSLRSLLSSAFFTIQYLRVIASAQTMSSCSPPPSPAITRRHKAPDHRVSFETGNGSFKVPSFFSQFVVAPASTVPVTSKASARHKTHHAHHGQSHSQSRKAQKASHVDRRARVEDVDDDDDLQGTCAGKATSNSGNVSDRDKSSALVSPVLDPSLPTITASAAAAGFPNKGRDVSALNGLYGFTGFNPAVGVNHVFTHLNNNGVPLQPYAVQSFPTFLTASNMAASNGFNAAATATHTVNGADSTSPTGLSFLPAVPDATNGPMMHAYVPRHDVSGQAGIFYVQQPQQQQQAMYTTVSFQPKIQIPSSCMTATSFPFLYPHFTSPLYLRHYNASAAAHFPPPKLILVIRFSLSYLRTQYFCVFYILQKNPQKAVKFVVELC